MTKRVFIASLTLALCYACAASQAKTRGLLFGVSQYPNFLPEQSLNAPKNDVARMRQALGARGVAADDLHILADGVEGSAGLPTRAAILDGLKRLASEAERGDFIIVYGSGHGSRQAAKVARKLDGNEQLFLPRDAQSQSGTASGGGVFGNAIVSHEFGEHLDAIRSKGADVWFLLDSCFSGGASRAAGDDVRDKSIDPADVGVTIASSLAPDQSLPLAERAALPSGAGKLIAFYASQPNETAREVALPPNAPMAKRAWGSIFTLALTRVMLRTPGLSYRQAMVETGRVLRSDPTFQARQTPGFEGDGLDLAMIGAAMASPVAAWSVNAGVLRAGQLEGVEEGAIVSLYDKPDVASGKPIGVAIVTRTEPLAATLAGLRAGCDPLKGACARDERSPALGRATYARMLLAAEGAVLKVSSLRAAAGVGAPDSLVALNAALKGALEGALKGRVAIDDATPAMIGRVDSGGVRFVPKGADAARSEAGPYVTSAGRSVEQLQGDVARALLRARQVLDLQRLEVASGGGGRGLQVSVSARRFAYNAVQRRCAGPPADQGALLPEGEALGQCDKAIVTLENLGGEAVLPVLFSLDEAWNLVAWDLKTKKPLCPDGLSTTDRLEPNRTINFEFNYGPAPKILPGRAPTTLNGVFVVGVPFRAGETGLPNLCDMQAFNDGEVTRADRPRPNPGQAAGEATRASLSMSFWPVKQPAKP